MTVFVGIELEQMFEWGVQNYSDGIDDRVGCALVGWHRGTPSPPTPRFFCCLGFDCKMSE